MSIVGGFSIGLRGSEPLLQLCPKLIIQYLGSKTKSLNTFLLHFSHVIHNGMYNFAVLAKF